MWLRQQVCAEVAGCVVMMVNFMLGCAPTAPLLLMLHAMVQPSSPVDRSQQDCQQLAERLCEALMRHSITCFLTCSQAGNSQGYSQLPSPQTGSTQVDVRIWFPMYASTSSLLEKVVVMPPAACTHMLARRTDN